MDEKIQHELKQAILKSLPILNTLLTDDNFVEPYLVWRKEASSSWRGEYHKKPALHMIFSAADNQLKKNGACFTEQFFERHSEYKGKVCVSGFGLFLQPNNIFQKIIVRFWERYETFTSDVAAVDAIVDEVVNFVNQPTIKYCFQAQLLNFEMAESVLILPENLSIRRLNEQEVSAFHGGSLTMHRIDSSQTFGIHEFVIEGEGETSKIFVDSLDDDSLVDRIISFNQLDQSKKLLNKAILCLRTFKEGPIGYNQIHFKPLSFFPCPFGTYGGTDLYIPFGRYELLTNEITALHKHAQLIFKASESAMEMACSRLADAEIRTRPQDRIVDAVIGMEALLLAGLGKEDRRGELKYRFSLHFSTLFHSPQERYNAFRRAKDLYDLRSAIAHGSSFTKDEYRVGEEKLSLLDASKRATEALRTIIQHFLPEAESAQYKQPEFWNQAYFQLPNNAAQ